MPRRIELSFVSKRKVLVSCLRIGLLVALGYIGLGIALGSLAFWEITDDNNPAQKTEQPNSIGDDESW